MFHLLEGTISVNLSFFVLYLYIKLQLNIVTPVFYEGTDRFFSCSKANPRCLMRYAMTTEGALLI